MTPMSPAESKYLALWQRMDVVVQAFSDAGRTEEADYFMSDFFLCFELADMMAVR